MPQAHLQLYPTSHQEVSQIDRMRVENHAGARRTVQNRVGEDNCCHVCFF